MLRDYLRLELVDSYAPYLSKPFADEHFDFYDHVLSDRWSSGPVGKR